MFSAVFAARHPHPPISSCHVGAYMHYLYMRLGVSACASALKELFECSLLQDQTSQQDEVSLGHSDTRCHRSSGTENSTFKPWLTWCEVYRDVIYHRFVMWYLLVSLGQVHYAAKAVFFSFQTSHKTGLWVSLTCTDIFQFYFASDQ